MKALKGVYAGSFDPITYGHESVIMAASNMYDLTVLVANNNNKKHLFNFNDRIKMVENSCPNNVKVDSLKEVRLLSDYCIENKIDVIVRGLRSLSDLEYELQIAHTNADLCNSQTIFIPTKANLSYISSSMVREVALLGGKVDKYVNGFVKNAIQKLK